ncbi:MAG TPA: DNA gyrase inhibitor YacG [Terriglobales bacterium]|nr:DNA gyrase inhibitor YacG [Terriglobales bacterium]
MPRKRVLSLRCPTCKKLVLRTDTEFPFCSERCRLIDLGKWASGGYVISTPITDPEEMGFKSNPQAAKEQKLPRHNDQAGSQPTKHKPQ